MLSNRGDPYKNALVVKRSLNPEHLLIIFGVLVRNRSMFVKVKSSLTPDILNYSGEEFHASFLRMLHEHFDSYSELPIKQAALAQMVSLSRDPGAGFYEGVIDAEIDSIYSLTEDASSAMVRSTENMASNLIEELLIDRKVINPTRSILSNSADSTLVNPGEILSSANQSLIEIRRLMTNTLVSSVPIVSRRMNTYVEFDHGMDFMNALTQGGLHRKSVSGLLGPFGSCKTTMATQAAASRINVEWQKRQRGESYEMVVYGNCEGPAEEISFRVLSYLAKIPLRAIKEHYYDITPLRNSISNDPEDYNNKYGLAITEIARLEEAVEKIQANFKIIDMATGGASNSIGKNSVDDLSVAIDAYTQHEGMGISLFILDYGKLFIRNYMAMNNIAADKIRLYLGVLPEKLRREISDKFNCAALALTQLNKDGNAKKPGTLLHHAEASEASDFGENCWFCFCLSLPFFNESGTQISNLNMSKARDAAPPRRMPALEYIPYCQGLRLTREFTVVGNTLRYEERRNTVMPVSPGPVRRPSSSRRLSTSGGMTSSDLNPLEGI